MRSHKHIDRKIMILAFSLLIAMVIVLQGMREYTEAALKDEVYTPHKESTPFDEVEIVFVGKEETASQEEQEGRKVQEIMAEPMANSEGKTTKEADQIAVNVSQALKIEEIDENTTKNVNNAVQKEGFQESEAVLIAQWLRAKTPSPQREKNIQQCQFKAPGIQFRCDYNWLIDAVTKKHIIISESPLLTMKIEEEGVPMRFLGQVSPFYLEDKNMYKEGFKIERVQFADRDAIKVKGYDIHNTKVRLQDYFFLNDQKLYQVQFSVYPKERWDEAQPVIKDIVESFAKVDNSHKTVTNFLEMENFKPIAF